ncbi:MAG: M61 family metallopeptidase [Acidobacteria bacterium]|nr:M61 family metallopeptidase [Acidobacteriota bacterium]
MPAAGPSPRSFASLILAAVLLPAAPGPASAQTLEPISYTVRFPAPATHYAEIVAEVPADGRTHVELMMATWTPGSYLIREYARHVEAVRAVTPAGEPLAVAKSSKNRWRIETGGADRVTVAYRVYCREMSVRTNWIEADFAMLNGAPTFLTPVGPAPRPHDVRIELPPEWSESVTALPPAPGGRPHSYRAADFDTLVDAPILAGNPTTYPFTVEGTPHALVNIGEGGVWDGPTSAADVERIVREQRRTWGFFPYERYLFLNMLVEAGGGLEHRDSTLLMTSRWTTRDRRRYLRWLGTVSHELFHAWNVKRLRPAALGPFDYEREAFTPSLWMVEGLTSYYGPLAVHRAGISTREELLEALSGQIEALQTTPGRLVQPVAEASYDAWIKYYRRNENSPNTTISYYTKGAVIGFLLEATGGRRSLDDVLKAAYGRYSGERGFRPGEFEAVASVVAGIDLGGWFDRAIRSTDELDYEPALAWYGLEFAPDARADDDAPAPAWLGLDTRTDRGRLLVAGVRRGTPGYEAGFNVGDEILAIGDYRVGPEAWRQRLGLYRAGDTVTVLVARRERLVRLDARFGEAPPEGWRLRPVESPSAAQTRRLDAWLDPGSTP